ncbi:uncharacterized protein LOC106462420 isoform X2 [Limulus polyphemus]|uniref:Uncharacterized protein LOC106462420 isoform X2 n=1 Tax=Limulus polyphemus TaxID=6850 RepID=A0ABM1SQ69_LIMPO|nr:uncharacterized protein LOC106462420 isoform X2 [Limulus polyphemus]
MGRKFNFSHLSDRECERIINVIQRDFQLRRREQERLTKIEGELNEMSSKRSVLAKRKEFNEKCCILCCSSFNLLFNKKLPCRDCHFFVCRNCASWESQEKVWLCRVCEQQRVLYSQSCEWFYDHMKQRFKHFGSAKVLTTLYAAKKESDSENDSGYGPSPSVVSSDGLGKPSKSLFAVFSTKSAAEHTETASNAALVNKDEDLFDKGLEEVRQHIETVIEGFLGESLDSAPVDKPYSHPLYIHLLNDHHTQLVEAVTCLSQALYLALQKKPFENGITPTSAHANLKQVFQRITEEASELPKLEVHEDENIVGSRRSSSASISTNGGFSDLFTSYEELIATAIINKIVSKQQQQYKTETDSTDVPDSGQQTVEKKCCSPVAEMPSANINGTSVDIGTQSDINEAAITDTDSSKAVSTDKGLSESEENSEDDLEWARGLGKEQEPIEYVVEEQVEEITEAFTDSGEDEERTTEVYSLAESPITKTVVERDTNVPDLDVLYAWDLSDCRRVPFPELGVDIVAGGDYEDDEDYNDPGQKYSDITSWEDNWLFQKKKLPFGNLGFRRVTQYYDPLSMLIPNPSETVKTRVGSRDLDELSDLTERNSAGSPDLQSDSESEEESLSPKIEACPELLQLARNIVSEFGLIGKENSSERIVNENRVSPIKNQVSPSQFQVSPNKNQVSGNKDNLSDFQKQPLSLECPVPKPRRTVSPLPTKLQLSVPAYQSPSSRKPPTSNPRFVEEPDSVSIHEGKVARFLCSVYGSRPLDVAWFKDGDLLTNGDRYQICFMRGRHLLEIYDSETKDSGTYSCVVFNNEGQHWSDFTLKVKETSRAWNPPSFVEPLRVVEGAEGFLGRLRCTVSGYPEPRLVLYHNDQLLNVGGKVTVECEGYGEWLIEIQRLTPEDQGEYTVVAVNKQGRLSSRTMLNFSNLDETENKKEDINKPDFSCNRSENVTKQVVKNNSSSTCHVSQRTWPEKVAEKEKKDDNTENQDLSLNPKYHSVHPVHVPQRTWPERVAEKEKKDAMTKESKLCKENSSRKAHELTSENRNVENFENASEKGFFPGIDLHAPPRPGTIAEREHKKWMNAVPLANNPYTAENLSKRMNRKVSEAVIPTRPMTFQDFEKQMVVEEKPLNDGVTSSDCFSSSDDRCSQYKRDYYVNDLLKSTREKITQEKSTAVKKDKEPPVNYHMLDEPEETLNSLEETVCTSARKVFTLEDRIRKLEKEVQSATAAISDNELVQLEAKIAQTASQVAQSDRQVSQIEKNVVQTQNALQQSGPRRNSGNVRTPSSGTTSDHFQSPLSESQSEDGLHRGQSDDEEMSLPSVKDLASRFLAVSATTKPKPSPRNTGISKALMQEKPVVVVEKQEEKELSPTPRKNTSLATTKSNFKVLEEDVSVKKNILKVKEDKEKVKQSHSRVLQEEQSSSAASAPSPLLPLKDCLMVPDCGASIKRVHSLTARSMSKEFREKTFKHFPRSLNRPLSVSQNENHSKEDAQQDSRGSSPSMPPSPVPVIESSVDPTHGYTSDESTTSNNSLPRHRTRRRPARSILQRASFWERRLEQGLMSDNSVSEDFPQLEEEDVPH